MTGSGGSRASIWVRKPPALKALTVQWGDTEGSNPASFSPHHTHRCSPSSGVQAAWSRWEPSISRAELACLGPALTTAPPAVQVCHSLATSCSLLGTVWPSNLTTCVPLVCWWPGTKPCAPGPHPHPVLGHLGSLFPDFPFCFISRTTWRGRAPFHGTSGLRE